MRKHTTAHHSTTSYHSTPQHHITPQHTTAHHSTPQHTTAPHHTTAHHSTPQHHVTPQHTTALDNRPTLCNVCVCDVSTGTDLSSLCPPPSPQLHKRTPMPLSQWAPPCSLCLECLWRYLCTLSHQTSPLLPQTPTLGPPTITSHHPLPSPPLQNRPEWHRNIEAAIQHYSVSKGRQPAISVVDSHGKFTVQLTYGKQGGGGELPSHLTPTHPLISPSLPSPPLTPQRS